MAPSVATSSQPTSFTAWGTSPVSSSMRIGSIGSGSMKRLGSSGPGLTMPPRPKMGTSATLCPVQDTACSSAFEDMLLRTRGITTANRRRSVASSPSGSPPEQQQSHHAVVLSPRGGLSDTPRSPSGSLIVGFNIGGASSTSTSTTDSIFRETAFPTAPSASAKAAASVPAARPAKAKGLLSKALDVPPPVMELASPTSSFSAPLDPLLQFSWFPNVDPRPLKQAQVKHSIFSSELVTTAYMIASRCYTGQLRKNGDTLLSHCLETAVLVADLGLDAETVAAALLHEALRSGDDFLSQLEEFMPRSVVERVERVQTITEVSQLYRSHGDRLSDEGMCRMLIAMEDVGAVIIKLADRVHNMRTVAALPHATQVALARETLDVYSVVANRLGVWYLKAELEDCAFAVLHPAEHATLRDQVRERHDPVGLQQTIDSIRSELDSQGIKYEDISGRQKNLYGIWTKMQRDNKTLDEVLDVVALRVVVATKHDCYLALRSVRDVYCTVPNRLKDYIKVQRKANGYQSLHDTVLGAHGRPVEVQIRTHKMHYIAEYGFAAHWKYKEKLDSEDEWLDKQVQYKKWLTHYKLGVHDKKVRPVGSPPTDASLKGLGFQYVDAACPEQLTQVDDFLKLDRFRLEPPPPMAASVHVQVLDTVEVRTLPAGLAAADLALQLGVGSSALAGHVLLLNGRVPALDAVLRSGDLIQVVTASVALGRSPPRSVPVTQTRTAAASVASAAAAATRHSTQVAEESWTVTETAVVPPAPQQRDLGGLDMFVLGRPQPVVLPFGSGTGAAPMGWGGAAAAVPMAVPVASH